MEEEMSPDIQEFPMEPISEVVITATDFVEPIYDVTDPEPVPAQNVEEVSEVVAVPRNVRKKKISRKNKLALEAYNVCKNTVKYMNLTKIHSLWCIYMKNHLKLEENFGGSIPNVDDDAYKTFSFLMMMTDYHGSMLSVLKCAKPQFVGVKGLCVIDTKKCFCIVQKDNTMKSVPKVNTVFKVHIGDMEIILHGGDLNIRPAERCLINMPWKLKAAVL